MPPAFGVLPQPSVGRQVPVNLLQMPVHLGARLSKKDRRRRKAGLRTAPERIEDGSRRDKIKLIGNGVCPPVTQAVIETTTARRRVDPLGCLTGLPGYGCRRRLLPAN